MNNEKQIFALGFFDGVHLGHQALLKACCALAERAGCETAAITFEAHPQSLFSANPPALLTTVQDRAALLKDGGIRHVRTLPVSEEVMSTPWEQFLEQLLDQGAAGFVCGDDFRFGSRGEGNARKLRDFCDQRNLPCVVVPEQLLEGQRVSSSLIRSLIEAGDMETANRYLGHPHVLSGRVLHGQKLGRTLGIPTANLVIPLGITVPKFGVYACCAHIRGKIYCAVANVGTRPTVNGSSITVEPWILDFEGDLYDQSIRLDFYRFLRPEIKFPDLTALQQQIRQDAQLTRHYFKMLSERVRPCCSPENF